MSTFGAHVSVRHDPRCTRRSVPGARFIVMAGLAHVAKPMERSLQDMSQASAYRRAETPYSVCVINLDRSTDRLARMKAELDGAGLDFVRIPGLLATALPPSLQNHFFNPDGRAAGAMKAGEIGCFAAHLSVCERMVEGTLAPVALVMEDDCLLPPNLADIVADILAVLPPSWDVVRLANQPKRAYVPLAVARSGHELIRYSRVPNCAAAYLVSLSGARKLLGPDRKSCAFDEYLRRPWVHGCENYGVWPAPIGFRDSPSSADSPSNIDQIEHRNAARRNALGKALSKTDLGNLPRRAAYNIKALGFGRWLACAAINASDRILKRFGSRDLLHRGSALLGNSSPEAQRTARML